MNSSIQDIKQTAAEIITKGTLTLSEADKIHQLLTSETNKNRSLGHLLAIFFAMKQGIEAALEKDLVEKFTHNLFLPKNAKKEFIQIREGDDEGEDRVRCFLKKNQRQIFKVDLKRIEDEILLFGKSEKDGREFYNYETDKVCLQKIFLKSWDDDSKNNPQFQLSDGESESEDISSLSCCSMEETNARPDSANFEIEEEKQEISINHQIRRRFLSMDDEEKSKEDEKRMSLNSQILGKNVMDEVKKFELKKSEGNEAKSPPDFNPRPRVGSLTTNFPTSRYHIPSKLSIFARYKEKKTVDRDPSSMSKLTNEFSVKLTEAITCDKSVVVKKKEKKKPKSFVIKTPNTKRKAFKDNKRSKTLKQIKKPNKFLLRPKKVNICFERFSFSSNSQAHSPKFSFKKSPKLSFKKSPKLKKLRGVRKMFNVKPKKSFLELTSKKKKIIRRKKKPRRGEIFEKKIKNSKNFNSFTISRKKTKIQNFGNFFSTSLITGEGDLEQVLRPLNLKKEVGKGFFVKRKKSRFNVGRY